MFICDGDTECGLGEAQAWWRLAEQVGFQHAHMSETKTDKSPSNNILIHIETHRLQPIKDFYKRRQMLQGFWQFAYIQFC